jgi:threonyl-tRNA synthetase
MAHAITELYPDAKLTIGPVVDEGYYYDIDHEPFKPEDLVKIEKRMKELAKKDIKISREDMTKKEAHKLFKDNVYKLELIEDLEDDNISIYRQDDFIDLCRGPHVPSTSYIRAFKLTKIAGAYWRADAKNKQLQRIYGISFPKQGMLEAHLKLLEEVEKRDHRKLSKELEIYSMHEEGPGFPFFLPNGMTLKNILIDFWRKEHKKAGYVEIQTPIILNKALWEKSGHWENYKENMYFTKIDNEDYAIKPMNCPGGMMVYKEKIHSYRELPMRVGELGIVHRHEMSGVLSGLFRVRVFTQDDAHIFMTPDQIKDEIVGVIDLVGKFYSLFGFKYNVELSTRPDKSIGTDEQWELATNGLKEALESKKVDFKINEGDGAFYGPKIDFHLTDCIGRTWQCGTIQLDMSLPDRFDLTYEGEDGKKHRPIMIHRVIYGSIERFMGILIEQYAGKFPLWLAPLQIQLLTVADRFNKYAEDLLAEFESVGLRVELDTRSESVSYKIRDAQVKKIPLVITIGEREVKDKTVSVRTPDGKVSTLKPDEFLKQILKNIEDKEQKIILS